MGQSASPIAPDLLGSALTAHDAGLCVLPPRQDGSKQPDVSSWTRYQQQRATRDELGRWYGNGRRTGLGYVCGAVSGHLELFEFDDRAVYDTFLGAAGEAELDDLVGRIRTGYEEITPGGGIHWFYRLTDTKTKTVALARRPGTDAAGKPRLLPLIETKGEGGYAVAAPSSGRVHPIGGTYQLVQGEVTTITTITAEERDALWALARSFDELPKVELSPTPRGGIQHDTWWIIRPGDAFNERATWAEVLEPHGWQAVQQRGDETLWRRPDGYPGGWGAATNHQGSDRLYVWTTATTLEPDRSYTKFAAHAIFNHDGDFAAAARALEAQGYGKRRSSPATPAPLAATPLAAIPPFPLEALPPVARTFVADGAAALGCPPDFVVVPLFGFIGALIGNSRTLRLKRGFEVLPSFWMGVVGRPGTVKTPALNLSRRLLDVLQQESWKTFKTDFDTWLDGKPTDRGPKPIPEHFFATDTTTEAIAHALQSSRGIAIIHDELAGWVLAFDNYKKGGDRQNWLSSWSGAPLKPNRKTAEPIYIPDPVVCVVGGIQPEVLPDLGGEAARDDGFIPRLLLSWPDAEPSPWTDAVMAESIFEAMLAAVRPLRLIGEDTVTIRLSAAAYVEWVAWFNENQALTAAARGLTAGWGAKAPVHLARIALVLHLVAYPEERERELSVDTMRDAVAVIEYFRAHLARVLPVFGATAPSHGVRLGTRIRTTIAAAFPRWVGRAELAIKLGGHEASAAIDAALVTLEEQGQVERQQTATAGRPREEWRWAGRRDEPADVEETVHRDGAGETLQRDKWKDVERPVSEDLSRNHVITHEPDSDPMGDWERWEEPL